MTRLIDYYVQIIAYVVYLVNTREFFQTSFEQVQADINRLIKESEARLKDSKTIKEDYDLACFALFAWVDETLMSSAWEGKGQWQKEQLQRKYFQTADAGELFFEKLNNLGPDQKDVREVFYICLALGFSGQYCNAGDEFLLEQLRISNLKLLTGSSAGVPLLKEKILFPEAYQQEVSETASAQKPALPTAASRFSLFFLIAAVAPAGLYLVLFIIYRFVLHNIGNTLISAVP